MCKKPFKISLWLIPVFLITVGACDKGPPEEDDLYPSLSEVYENAFLIGAALNEAHIYREDVRGIALTQTHFNSITAENVMKWEEIHPEPGRFDFDAADRFVEFGEEHDMFIIGHTLVWHSQTPGWVFEDEEGNPLERDELLDRMREHIHTVVGRYKGRVDGWDVVNEALEEDGSMRESPWYRIIGEDYIEKAFEFAREADPDAELYYNDYSLENSPKRDGAVRLMEQLLAQEVPITGIGTQGHFSLDWPDPEEVEQTVVDFADLGLDVMVTELDIDVLPQAMDHMGADVSVNVELRDELNPWPEELPDSVQQELTKRYAELFEVFLGHRDKISRITFWGVNDGDSWKNDWPVQGRTNYPLLFDREGQPKPAFFTVVEKAEEILSGGE